LELDEIEMDLIRKKARRENARTQKDQPWLLNEQVTHLVTQIVQGIAHVERSRKEEGSNNLSVSVFR
jgi:hypothetical protein